MVERYSYQMRPDPEGRFVQYEAWLLEHSRMENYRKQLEQAKLRIDGLMDRLERMEEYHNS